MFRSTQTFPDRFFAHVDMRQGECWGWHGKVDRHGYGGFWVDDVSGAQKAHRVAYELLIGAIPDGLVIDHLCRNRACVNPSHLEPVTAAENTRRGLLVRPPKTHCVNGHELEDENVYVTPDGIRRCRTCLRAADRKRKERKRKPRPDEIRELAAAYAMHVYESGRRAGVAQLTPDGIAQCAASAAVVLFDTRHWNHANVKRVATEEVERRGAAAPVAEITKAAA